MRRLIKWLNKVCGDSYLVYTRVDYVLDFDLEHLKYCLHKCTVYGENDNEIQEAFDVLKRMKDDIVKRNK